MWWPSFSQPSVAKSATAAKSLPGMRGLILASMVEWEVCVCATAYIVSNSSTKRFGWLIYDASLGWHCGKPHDSHQTSPKRLHSIFRPNRRITIYQKMFYLIKLVKHWAFMVRTQYLEQMLWKQNCKVTCLWIWGIQVTGWQNLFCMDVT